LHLNKANSSEGDSFAFFDGGLESSNRAKRFPSKARGKEVGPALQAEVGRLLLVAVTTTDCFSVSPPISPAQFFSVELEVVLPSCLGFFFCFFLAFDFSSLICCFLAAFN
jgi:hypothetical protein